MGDHFKPWRRRFGLVTLVLALVFIGGWVRGLYIMDQLRYGNPSRTPFVLAQNGPPGRFIFDCCNMEPISQKFKLQWRSHPTRNLIQQALDSDDVLGRFFYRWVDSPNEIASDGYQAYSRWFFTLLSNSCHPADSSLTLAVAFKSSPVDSKEKS